MKLETSEIQAIIVTGYSHLPWSRYLFLRIDNLDPAQKWLAEIARRTTHSNWKRESDGVEEKPNAALNIAITAAGLRAFGLDDCVMGTFPEEFVQGMTDPARSRRLGDNGDSDPSRWEIGNPVDEEIPVHILLILEAADLPALDQMTEQYRHEMCGVSESCKAETGEPQPDQKEHFGFRDSISQPEIDGTPKGAKAGKECLKTGEFILGYPNEHGVLPPTPTVPAAEDFHDNLPPLVSSDSAAARDLGRNGSFLVFRKLRQHVGTFHEFVDANASPDDRALLAAKFVGRWPSGASLVLSPHADVPPGSPIRNDFGYARSDPHGFACPLGAHVRRANPRDAMENREAGDSSANVRRHRILRRGAAYGSRLEKGQSDDGADRGLLFVCINADIKRQFEFIQQTWINNSKFHGLTCDRDPLIGDNEEPGDTADRLQPRMFTIQSPTVRRRVASIPRFITMKGGGYFFLPSISALFFIARSPRVKSVAAC